MRFDDAHLQDVDLGPDKGARQIPASREETFQARSHGASTWVPVRRRWRGQLAVGRSKEETQRPRAACSRSGRVAPGCASSAEAPRRRGPGATAFCGWGNPIHGAEPCEPPPPHEPASDLQRKGSGGRGRTRGRGGRVHVELSGGDVGGTANPEGHPRPFLRKSPETADVRERYRTGAPQWRVLERRSRLAH